MENFNEVDGSDGNIAHHGIWKIKRKIFPKIKPSLPVGKKNLKGQLITNQEELKDLDNGNKFFLFLKKYNCENLFEEIKSRSGDFGADYWPWVRLDRNSRKNFFKINKNNKN